MSVRETTAHDLEIFILGLGIHFFLQSKPSALITLLWEAVVMGLGEQGSTPATLLLRRGKEPGAAALARLL